MRSGPSQTYITPASPSSGKFPECNLRQGGVYRLAETETPKLQPAVALFLVGSADSATAGSLILRQPAGG